VSGFITVIDCIISKQLDVLLVAMVTRYRLQRWPRVAVYFHEV